MCWIIAIYKLNLVFWFFFRRWHSLTVENTHSFCLSFESCRTRIPMTRTRLQVWRTRRNVSEKSRAELAEINIIVRKQCTQVMLYKMILLRAVVFALLCVVIVSHPFHWAGGERRGWPSAQLDTAWNSSPLSSGNCIFLLLLVLMTFLVGDIFFVFPQSPTYQSPWKYRTCASELGLPIFGSLALCFDRTFGFPILLPST